MVLEQVAQWSQIAGSASVVAGIVFGIGQLRQFRRQRLMIERGRTQQQPAYEAYRHWRPGRRR